MLVMRFERAGKHLFRRLRVYTAAGYGRRRYNVGFSSNVNVAPADRFGVAAIGSAVNYPALPYPISSYTHGAEFVRRLGERILIMDGAMGTMVQQFKLAEGDFRGSRFAEHGRDVKGNNELLSLVKPDIISDIHRQYLDADADIISTNTFGAT